MKTFLFTLFWLSISASATCWAFTSVNYPGAANTVAEDVSDGRVVGYYWDTFPNQHGFVFDGTSYVTLDYPGSYATTILGIDGSQIVGAYLDLSGNMHGFVYDGSTFQTLTPPDAINSANGTGATGVSGSQVVGFYRTSPTRSHGFLFDGPSYTTIDYPGGQTDALKDIDGQQIVGTTRIAGATNGYIYSGTSFQLLNHPLAGSSGTYPTGVSGVQSVGYYYDNASRSHGFIYQLGQFQQYDVPLEFGDFTQLNGIDGNNVVGTYRDRFGNQRGFATTIPEPTTLTLILACTAMMCARHRSIVAQRPPVS